MITFPNAKINLGLNITEKRPDGYHNLETIFYPIPLEDALEVCTRHEGEGKYSLTQSGLSIEGDIEKNLVVKAYKLLQDEGCDLPPVDIYLHKHIPSGAGLGGGSADAAFMLKLLNGTYNLHLTEDCLEEYAARLGADCAFFIRNQPTYAEGIGNIFSPVELSLTGWQLLLVKPNVFVSTRDAFARICPQHPAHNLKDIIKLPIEKWKDYMINDFEESVFPQFPTIGDIKAKLYRLGAVYASMSGSGSSVYGLFAPGSSLPDADFGTESQVFRLTLK